MPYFRQVFVITLHRDFAYLTYHNLSLTAILRAFMMKGIVISHFLWNHHTSRRVHDEA